MNLTRQPEGECTSPAPANYFKQKIAIRNFPGSGRLFFMQQVYHTDYYETERQE